MLPSKNIVLLQKVKYPKFKVLTYFLSRLIIIITLITIIILIKKGKRVRKRKRKVFLFSSFSLFPCNDLQEAGAFPRIHLLNYLVIMGFENKITKRESEHIGN